MECRNLDDVYKTVKRAVNRKEDSVFIFVDWMFCDEAVFRQVEMFRYEFEDFRIIVDARMAVVLDLNKKIYDRVYYLTDVSENANELF